MPMSGPKLRPQAAGQLCTQESSGGRARAPEAEQPQHSFYPSEGPPASQGSWVGAKAQGHKLLSLLMGWP